MSRHVRAAVMALVAAAACGGAAAAQEVAGGPILRVLPPERPWVTLEPGLVQAGPWDPLGILGPPSPIGPSPFAVEAPVLRVSDIIVLPALFSDSPEPHVPAEDIQRILFDGPREGGTFTEFYHEASRGRISPTGTVAPWVRTSLTMMDAAGDPATQKGHGLFTDQTADYIAEAVALADASVDYREFDNDGPDGMPDSGDDDGFIDVLVVEYLEVAGSCGGPAIWPHFYALFVRSETGEILEHGIPTDDIGANGQPIRAYTYLTQSVTDCGGDNPQGPNVIAHEYGHRLGLPDFYNAVGGIEPENRHWNIGCFGIMGAGSWGCGTGIKAESFGPVHHSAWSKVFLGWMDQEVVENVLEKEYVLEPAQTTGRALRIPLDAAGEESFLIEYRPQVLSDAAWLPAGGVIVYHEDIRFTQRAVPSGLPPAKRLHLVEADGDHALRKVERLGGNRGVAGDVFGIDGRTGPYSSAEGPVRLHRHEGQPVPVTIHSVVAEGDVARLVLSVHPIPTLMAAEPGSGLRALEEGTLAEFRLAGGALPYTVVDEDPDADFTVTMADTEGVVTGTPLDVGTVEIELRITDALGTTTTETFIVSVDDAADLDLDGLIDAILGAPGAPPGHASYLDGQGNENGRADVGDLRAWLRRTGQL